jgi:hypothetical protein
MTQEGTPNQPVDKITELQESSSSLEDAIQTMQSIVNEVNNRLDEVPEEQRAKVIERLQQLNQKLSEQQQKLETTQGQLATLNELRTQFTENVQKIEQTIAETQKLVDVGNAIANQPRAAVIPTTLPNAPAQQREALPSGTVEFNCPTDVRVSINGNVSTIHAPNVQNRTSAVSGRGYRAERINSSSTIRITADPGINIQVQFGSNPNFVPYMQLQTPQNTPAQSPETTQQTEVLRSIEGAMPEVEQVITTLEATKSYEDIRAMSQRILPKLREWNTIVQNRADKQQLQQTIQRHIQRIEALQRILPSTNTVPDTVRPRSVSGSAEPAPSATPRSVDSQATPSAQPTRTPVATPQPEANDALRTREVVIAHRGPIEFWYGNTANIAPSNHRVSQWNDWYSMIPNVLDSCTKDEKTGTWKLQLNKNFTGVFRYRPMGNAPITTIDFSKPAPAAAPQNTPNVAATNTEAIPATPATNQAPAVTPEANTPSANATPSTEPSRTADVNEAALRAANLEKFRQLRQDIEANSTPSTTDTPNAPTQPNAENSSTTNEVAPPAPLPEDTSRTPLQAEPGATTVEPMEPNKDAPTVPSETNSTTTTPETARATEIAPPPVVPEEANSTTTPNETTELPSLSGLELFAPGNYDETGEIINKPPVTEPTNEAPATPTEQTNTPPQPFPTAPEPTTNTSPSTPEPNTTESPVTSRSVATPTVLDLLNPDAAVACDPNDPSKCVKPNESGLPISTTSESPANIPTPKLETAPEPPKLPDGIESRNGNTIVFNAEKAFTLRFGTTNRLMNITGDFTSDCAEFSAKRDNGKYIVTLKQPCEYIAANSAKYRLELDGSAQLLQAALTPQQLREQQERMQTGTITITSEQELNDIIASHDKVIVKLGFPECHGCDGAQPTVDNLSTRALVLDVNIKDANLAQLPRRFNTNAYPSVFVLDRNSRVLNSYKAIAGTSVNTTAIANLLNGL